jgi:hypothetical protein
LEALGVTADEMVGRRELLEHLGAFYGAQHFALVFTQTNRARHPDDDRPKKVTTPAWQTTQPLPHAARGVALLTSRGQHMNPAITLRTSGLVGIECDGDEDLARVHALGLPATLTERTSAPSKLHFYFRAPELETLPKVSFRFESGKLTGAANNYYVCAPALHPSGAVYSHLPGLGPEEVEIVVLPEDIYLRLLHDADGDREVVQINGGPISAGARHEHLRHLSYVMRRYAGASREALEAALLAENAARCVPPKEARLVCALAAYTYDHIEPKGPKR